jgi:putative component of membrane protein insertase Oxa1/YidC/SpoIIIJ protein YidD
MNFINTCTTSHFGPILSDVFLNQYVSSELLKSCSFRPTCNAWCNTKYIFMVQLLVATIVYFLQIP